MLVYVCLDVSTKQAKLVVLPLIVNFSCVVVMMMWGVAIAGRSEPKLT